MTQSQTAAALLAKANTLDEIAKAIYVCDSRIATLRPLKVDERGYANADIFIHDHNGHAKITNSDIRLDKKRAAELAAELLKKHRDALQSEYDQALIEAAKLTPYCVPPGSENYEIIMAHKMVGMVAASSLDGEKRDDEL